MVLDRLKNFVKKDKDFLKIKLPRHIAISMDGIENWALKNGISYEESYKKAFLALKSTIRSQVKLNIPIISFYVLEEGYDKDSEAYPYFFDSVAEMLNDLADSEFIKENKIKISILGKWYKLPARIVDAIKKIVESTKDYDSFFVNLCINYDGQEEIVDAMRLIAMQVKAGKMDPELISKDSVKENLYSSYFLPPDLMIKNGIRKETSGFFLWDSVNTKIYFTNKLWPDFDRTEFMDAIREFQKGD
ncbi:di-trans,poly-cis-decaprenylcistransferase [Candidatus Woesearchaeota archaeon]|nr:di-trans,poly-cis-decaprenylcistransferase [Candidatus Woesearchaeota archaeon]